MCCLGFVLISLQDGRQADQSGGCRLQWALAWDHLRALQAVGGAEPLTQAGTQECGTWEEPSTSPQGDGLRGYAHGARGHQTGNKGDVQARFILSIYFLWLTECFSKNVSVPTFSHKNPNLQFL